MPKILSFFGWVLDKYCRLNTLYFFKDKFFRLTTQLRSGKGNEKQYTLYEKEHEKEPPHSSLGWHLLIKLESFGDKNGDPFLCKRESIWFGNGMIDGTNEMVY